MARGFGEVGKVPSRVLGRFVDPMSYASDEKTYTPLRHAIRLVAAQRALPEQTRLEILEGYDNVRSAEGTLLDVVVNRRCYGLAQVYLSEVIEAENLSLEDKYTLVSHAVRLAIPDHPRFIEIYLNTVMASDSLGDGEKVRLLQLYPDGGGRALFQKMIECGDYGSALLFLRQVATATLSAHCKLRLLSGDVSWSRSPANSLANREFLNLWIRQILVCDGFSDKQKYHALVTARKTNVFDLAKVDANSIVRLRNFIKTAAIAEETKKKLVAVLTSTSEVAGARSPAGNNRNYRLMLTENPIYVAANVTRHKRQQRIVELPTIRE